METVPTVLGVAQFRNYSGDGICLILQGLGNLQPCETWKVRICFESVSGVFPDSFPILLRKCLTVVGAPPTNQSLSVGLAPPFSWVGSSHIFDVLILLTGGCLRGGGELSLNMRGEGEGSRERAAGCGVDGKKDCFGLNIQPVQLVCSHTQSIQWQRSSSGKG